MKLVQILLPTRDNRGRKFKKAIFGRIRKELVDRFGGLTAYSRSPAKGVWKSRRATKLDDIMVLEIMTAEVNRNWWKQYRRKLERALRQDEIVVRVQDIRII
jgi:hypothetical protein